MISVIRVGSKPDGQPPTLREPVIDWNAPPLTADESEKQRKRTAESRRNFEVFESRIPEIYANYRGQFVCIAGGELFVGPDHREVQARAEAAHPDTRLSHYHRYIRTESGPRV